ncbi:hypothetical protein ONZ45_g7538 [Pleurotus djamor]|nr:hypothetical protein ONZ45_g7538 [Pleurotus djamor]
MGSPKQSRKKKSKTRVDTEDDKSDGVRAGPSEGKGKAKALAEDEDVEMVDEEGVERRPPSPFGPQFWDRIKDFKYPAPVQLLPKPEKTSKPVKPNPSGVKSFATLVPHLDNRFERLEYAVGGMLRLYHGLGETFTAAHGDIVGMRTAFEGQGQAAVNANSSFSSRLGVLENQLGEIRAALGLRNDMRAMVECRPDEYIGCSLQ